eukprot:1969480-Pleurochrysis_carterae.AAC.4
MLQRACVVARTFVGRLRCLVGGCRLARGPPTPLTNLPDEPKCASCESGRALRMVSLEARIARQMPEARLTHAARKSRPHVADSAAKLCPLKVGVGARQE